jgi:hypothetical protein
MNDDDNDNMADGRRQMAAAFAAPRIAGMAARHGNGHGGGGRTLVKAVKAGGLMAKVAWVEAVLAWPGLLHSPPSSGFHPPLSGYL